MWLLAATFIHWLTHSPKKTCNKADQENSTSISADHPNIYIQSICQCDGLFWWVWHFPWSRNACGIYGSPWLYIPNNCMFFPHFGLLPFLLYDSAGTGTRICNTANTVYLSNVSSDPLFFSVAFYSPLNCWHFRMRRSSLCSVAFTLIQSHLCYYQPVSVGQSAAAASQCCSLMVQSGTAGWHAAALQADCAI